MASILSLDCQNVFLYGILLRNHLNLSPSKLNIMPEVELYSALLGINSLQHRHLSTNLKSGIFSLCNQRGVSRILTILLNTSCGVTLVFSQPVWMEQFGYGITRVYLCPAYKRAL